MINCDCWPTRTVSCCISQYFTIWHLADGYEVLFLFSLLATITMFSIRVVHNVHPSIFYHCVFCAQGCRGAGARPRCLVGVAKVVSQISGAPLNVMHSLREVKVTAVDLTRRVQSRCWLISYLCTPRSSEEVSALTTKKIKNKKKSLQGSTTFFFPLFFWGGASHMDSHLQTTIN